MQVLSETYFDMDIPPLYMHKKENASKSNWFGFFKGSFHWKLILLISTENNHVHMVPPALFHEGTTMEGRC